MLFKEKIKISNVRVSYKKTPLKLLYFKYKVKTAALKLRESEPYETKN